MMMNMECEHLLDGYFEFLRKNLVEIKDKEECKLELPFPRPANDFIVLTITKENENEYKISDEGFIFDYLFSYGIDLWNLTSGSMQDVLRQSINRYKIDTTFKPEIVIKTEKKNLYYSIFRMSNILNELSSLKLLVTYPTYNIFRKKIEKFFDQKNIKFIKNPKIKVSLREKDYSFPLDYKFKKKPAYAKIITSDSIIKNWAVNFDQIRRYHEEDQDIKLWALYDDKDSVDSSKVDAFLSDYADEIIAWSINRNKFETLK